MKMGGGLFVGTKIFSSKIGKKGIISSLKILVIGIHFSFSPNKVNLQSLVCTLFDLKLKLIKSGRQDVHVSFSTKDNSYVLFRKRTRSITIVSQK